MNIPIFHRRPGPVYGSQSNDAASAGHLGELISATVALGSGVALTTNTPADMTTITLTPGDWDVSLNMAFRLDTNTSITAMQASLGTTTATLSTVSGRLAELRMAATVIGNNNLTLMIVPFRFSVSVNTIIYAVAQATFTVSTCAASGILRARRMR